MLDRCAALLSWKESARVSLLWDGSKGRSEHSAANLDDMALVETLQQKHFAQQIN